MNVLSIPTWIIHISSVIEWMIAIWLISDYAQITNNKVWLWFALAMLPALVSAMCACTWHYFDNPLDLEWMVTLQAAMTLLSNMALAIVAYMLYQQREIKS